MRDIYSAMIHTRAVDCPAGGRSVFSAYNVHALDIRRKQTKRVTFSCGQKRHFASAKIKSFVLTSARKKIIIFIVFFFFSTNQRAD
jgi:hypothetical protein